MPEDEKYASFADAQTDILTGDLEEVEPEAETQGTTEKESEEASPSEGNSETESESKAEGEASGEETRETSGETEEEETGTKEAETETEEASGETKSGEEGEKEEERKAAEEEKEGEKEAPALTLPEGWSQNEQGEIGYQDGDRFITLEEHRAGYLRQSDYTEKTTVHAQEVQQFQQALQDQQALAREIAASEQLQEFLGDNPDALPQLLADPRMTRDLINNPSKIQAAHEQWNAIKENPALMQQVAGATNLPPEVQQAVDFQKQAQEHQAVVRGVQVVASTLNDAVDAAASRHPDVNVDAVKNRIVALGGMQPDDIKTPEHAIEVFGTLQRMFFDPATGEMSGSSLIEQAFAMEAAVRQPDKSAEEKPPEKQEAHNKGVEEALKGGGDAPPSAAGGGTPKAPPKKDDTKPYKDHGEAMQDILFGD